MEIMKLSYKLGLCAALLLLLADRSRFTKGACDESKAFTCDNGQCVYIAFRCDGENDCGDFSDENDCIPEPLPDHEFVVVVDSTLKNIFQLWPETGEIHRLLPAKTPNPVAVTIDFATKDIYYTDASDATIGRIRVDAYGARSVKIIYKDNTGGAMYDGLAIDSQRGKLYYSDGGVVGSLGELSTDGTAHRVLHMGRGMRPRGIVIDPINRLLYWTDWGDTPSISVMNVVTLKRRLLVSSNILLPNALVIDAEENYMYWADAGRHTLEQSKTDGTGRHVLLTNRDAHYFALALSPRHLYVNDWKLNCIRKVTWSTSLIEDQEPLTFAAIRGIAVYYPPAANTTGDDWYQSRHPTRVEL